MEEKQNEMVTRKTWNEFRATGLFWWVNMILHTFGWVLVVEVDMETDEVVCAYPARTKFRGFNEEFNDVGYQKVSRYMKENAEEIYLETFDEEEKENENER